MKKKVWSIPIVMIVILMALIIFSAEFIAPLSLDY